MMEYYWHLGEELRRLKDAGILRHGGTRQESVVQVAPYPAYLQYAHSRSCINLHRVAGCCLLSQACRSRMGFQTSLSY